MSSISPKIEDQHPNNKTVSLEQSTSPSSVFWMISLISSVPDRIRTINKLRETLDVKEICKEATEKKGLLAYPITVLPTRTSHLFNDPDAMKAILKEPRNDPQGLFKIEKKTSQILALFKMFFPNENLELNDLILTCQATHSQKYRSLLLNTFTISEIKSHYSSHISTLAKETLDRWSKQTGPINMSRELRLFTSTVISKFVLGFPDSSKSDKTKEEEKIGYNDIAEAADLVNEMYIRKMFFFEIDEEKLAKAQKVMQKAIDICLVASNTPLIQMLKQLETVSDPLKKFTRLQSKAMLCTLFIAGQETSVTVLTELFWQLAQQPNWQNKIAEEIGGLNNDESTNVVAERARTIKTIEQTIIETLRTKPPVYVTSRQLNVPLQIKEKKNHSERTYGPLPEGDILTVCPFSAANDPERYPEPDRFDPLRHSDKSHMTWLPFGDGRHKCPGQSLFWEEAVQLIFQTIGNYQISTPQEKKPLSKGMMTDHFVEDLQITLSARSILK